VYLFYVTSSFKCFHAHCLYYHFYGRNRNLGASLRLNFNDLVQHKKGLTYKKFLKKVIPKALIDIEILPGPELEFGQVNH
jgi:hypothetical protein